MLTIVSEPQKIVLEASGVGGSQDRLIIPCSDGIDYNLTDLADKIGLSPPGLARRLKIEGWERIDVLRKPNKARQHFKNPSGLSNKRTKAQRLANLNKIPDFTDFEEKLWGEKYERRSKDNHRWHEL